MKTLWTAAEIAEATGGAMSGQFDAGGVAFDSREISEGDLFFALKGELSDGHRYLDQSFRQGAAGAVTSEDTAHPHIKVGDTHDALDALAKASRARSDAKIIGVTGSAGKTGTKEALYAALNRSSRGLAHRSVKSYNNHVGVPLSLARMPAASKYGVFEMGMNAPGELRALTQLVQPDVAIVTTVAPAHIGFFKDETEIAHAKAEIFEGLKPGGLALVPADNKHFALLAKTAREYTDNVLSFGMSDTADIRAIDVVDAEGGGYLVTAKLASASLCYTISQPGKYWITNSLAVLGAVEAVGGDLAAAGLALAELGGIAGRGARHSIAAGDGEALLIDESYNANPASMELTIEQLGRTDATRRIAVLGMMAELGDKSEMYHAAIAPYLASAKVDYAILVGDEMQKLVHSLSQGVEGPAKFDHCDDAQAALALLTKEYRAGDAILVKGSNSVGLTKIISGLIGEGT